MTDEEYNDMISKVMPLITVGRSVRIFYNEGNPNNKLLHVRALVDGEYAVVREWSARKQFWFYLVKPVFDLAYLYKEGKLFPGPKSRG